MEPSLDFRNPFATASAISVTHEVALQSFSLQPLKRWANHMRKVWPTRKKGPRFRGGASSGRGRWEILPGSQERPQHFRTAQPHAAPKPDWPGMLRLHPDPANSRSSAGGLAASPISTIPFDGHYREGSAMPEADA